jgi:molybdenum cofactor guanylyltransferase
MTPESVDAVILAGGRARRLGGVDKGLLPLRGRPLVAWVAQRLAPQVDSICISANRHLDEYAALGYPVVPDTLPDHPGPLAGILAATAAPGREWVLTTPCDTPFLPADLVRSLLAAARQAGVPLARAASPEQTHYAVMLVHRALLPDLAGFVASGGRQVQAWQARHAHVDVRFEVGEAAFFNVNTPDDLARAEAMVAALASAGTGTRIG